MILGGQKSIDAPNFLKSLIALMTKTKYDIQYINDKNELSKSTCSLILLFEFFCIFEVL
jgi:hypothetical protein